MVRLNIRLQLPELLGFLMGFDERFRRMWEMYLACCEGSFRAKSIDVGQFKLVKS